MNDLPRLIQTYNDFSNQGANDQRVDSGLPLLIAATYLGEKLDKIATLLDQLNEAKELPNT